MDHFICEIYDLPNLTGFDVSKVLDIKTATLNYTAMLTDTRIEKNLLFSWVWRRVFGVFPSKIDMYNYSSTGIGGNNMQDMMRYLFDKTFVKYSQNVFEPNLPLWNGEFNNYKSQLQNTNFVKGELVKKLCDRFCIFLQAEHFEGKSLWNVFKVLVERYGYSDIQKLYSDEKAFITEHNIVNVNPLTGSRLLNNKVEGVGSFNTLTRYDALKMVFVRDFYFMRVTFLKTCLIAFGAKASKEAPWMIETLSKIVNGGGKVVVFATSKDISNVCCSHKSNPFVFEAPSFDIKMFHSIPSVFAKAIVFMPPEDEPIWCKPMTLNNQDTYTISDKSTTYNPSTRFIQLVSKSNTAALDEPIRDCVLPFEFDTFISSTSLKKSIMELYLRTRNPYVNIRYHDRNVQESFVYVVDKATRFCIKNQVDATRLSTSPYAKNCVLLIDNRENPFSLLSACVTFANLKPKSWNLVIVSSPKSINYYKEELVNQDVMYLTHPLLEKENFDIEDYTNLLKSPDIWKLMKDFDNCLTIQDDGFLIRKGLEDKILGKYDYIGSPWAKVQGNEQLETAANPYFVGNGGLSMRNIKMMIDITTDPDAIRHAKTLFNNDLQHIPEDVFFSNQVYKRGGRIPKTIEEAGIFASEQIKNENSLGIHKPWAYLTFQDILHIFNGF